MVMTEAPKKKLGEILVEGGQLTRDHLNEALSYQKSNGGLLGQILVSLGYVTEVDVVSALAVQMKIPYLPLSNYSVNMDTAREVGEEFCRRHLVVPFDQDDRYVFVSAVDPLNDTIVEELHKTMKLKPRLFVSTATEIINMLDVCFSGGSTKKEK